MATSFVYEGAIETVHLKLVAGNEAWLDPSTYSYTMAEDTISALGIRDLQPGK